MVAWASLPVEIRNEIAKELDFRTRFRFRHVSKSDQYLIDSLPLNLPRIVLEFKSDDNAKLEFYLGINRKIVVDFEKNKKNKKKKGQVKVTVSGESIDNPIVKHVKFENAALLAVNAFKNVAINPKTLLDGLEFRHDKNLTSHTRLKIYQIIKKKGIRTRTLCVSGTTNLSLILSHCSTPDLLEIQSIDNEQDGGMIPLSMVTYTRKLKINVENMPLGNMYDISQTYTPSEDRTVHHVQVESRVMEYPGFRREQRALGDVTLKGWLGPEFTHHRFSLCGNFSCASALPLENENPGECELRWTCATHADPFEYWYYKQIIEPKPANLTAGFADLFDIAREHVADVLDVQEALEMPIPGMLPLSYREVLYPIANGIDPVYVMKTVMLKAGNDWEQDMLRKYPTSLEVLDGSAMNALKLEDSEDSEVQGEA